MTTDVVAILGRGRVGQALGSRLRRTSVEVRYGVRDPSAVEPGGDQVLTAAEAVEGASVVLVAVPAAAAISVLGSAGPLAGKTIVDCTNPLRWDGGPVWDPPVEGSTASAIAAAYPDAHVVKAFNHFGAEIQQEPELAHGPAQALVASDNDAAKAVVLELARVMGFEPVDAGPLRNASLLENLAVLWIHLAGQPTRDRHFSFRIEGRGA